jgi:hypothetical protein
MAGEVWVDTPALKNAAGKIDDPNETITRALNAFYATANGLGPKPWGTGEIGAKFEEQYLGLTEPSFRDDGKRGSEAVLASIADLRTGLGNLQKRTHAMADEYDHINEANSQ